MASRSSAFRWRHALILFAAICISGFNRVKSANYVSRGQGMRGAMSIHRTSKLRRLLQDESNSDRKGMGWVVEQFPLEDRLRCDATFYHSPLVVNVTRPDRPSFCLKISSRAFNGKYSCNVAPFVGQVSILQVLAGATCGDAITAVTVNGQDWPYQSFDKYDNILSVERLHAAALPNASNPSAHEICIYLNPEHETCASLPAFCAPTYGPEPACGILIADRKGACCPVNRVGYENILVQGGLFFQFSARLNGRRYGCEEAVQSEALTKDLTGYIAAQYGRELGLPASNFAFSSYRCRGGRWLASMTAVGLKGSQPEAILTQSTMLLRPVAIALGLTSIRVTPVAAPPPPPLPPSLHEVSSPPVAPSPPPVYGSRPPVYGA